MDLSYVIDGIIHSYISKNNLWKKFDADNSHVTLYNKIVKKVLDTCGQFQCSANMLSARNITSRIEEVRNYRKKLNKLLDIPLIEQRSEEWFNMRYNMITASDFGDALAIDKFGKKTDPNKIYEKKCGYEPPQEYNMASVFLKWGVMFEPVATQLYETRNGVKVHEFGLIQNPRHSFLGASPDGISEMGIMLEIKCPYKRIITDDSILKQYYYQIQGQLDACDLQECDFLEVRFDKYENFDSFKEDYESEQDTFTHNYKEKGIIIEKSDGSYIYSPFNSNRDTVLQWYRINTIDSNVKTITYWYMHSFSIKRVAKDRCFIDTINMQLTDVWNNIVKYRNDKSLYMEEVTNSSCKRKNNTKANTKANTKVNVGSMFIHDPNENQTF